MRDLALWRRLDTGDVTPDELRALSAWPLPKRAVFVGRLRALATSTTASPEVRAAALFALGGARGVPGLRAIVAALADDDERVRAGALEALRTTAKDAPVRYAHAVFHPRVDVRRAALVEVPPNSAEMTAYLRADPATADLVQQSAWPAERLPLMFDLHAAGRLPSAELVKLVSYTPQQELRAFFATEPGRSAPVVSTYIVAMLRGEPVDTAPGHDPLDQLVHAIAEAGAFERPLEHLVQTMTTGKRGPLLARGIVALRSYLATASSPPLWGALAALEPRVLLVSELGDATRRGAIAHGLIRFAWPVRVAGPFALLRLPEVRADFALTAALTGLLPSPRLRRLEAEWTREAILDALVASDHGFAELCRLPQEAPNLELQWLGAIAAVRPERYVALAGIALGAFTAKRLEMFIDQMPRRHRHHALLAYLATGVADDDEHLLAVASMLGSRLERPAWAEVLATLLVPDAGERELRIALWLARVMKDKVLHAVAKLLSDAAVLRLVRAHDDLDPLPRECEVALAEVAAGRADPELGAWSERVLRVVTATVVVPLPAIRGTHALDLAQIEKIRTAPTEAALEAAVQPALTAPSTGLVGALAARPAGESLPACAALLACVDPMHDVAVQLDRFAGSTPRFDNALDKLAAVMWRSADDLPPLAHARLWRWEAHTDALLRWVDATGGVHRALLAIDALPGRVAAPTIWAGVAEALTLLRYRDRPRFLKEATPELARFAAERIDRAVGRSAARVCVALVETRAVPLSTIRQTLLDHTPDATADAREHVARLIRLDGMPDAPAAVASSTPEVSTLEQIRQAGDLDVLATWCADPRRWVVQEAVLVMLTLGVPGQLRLARLLSDVASLPSPVPLLASIGLWESDEALAIARALVATAALPPEWQFRLCLGLDDAAGAIAAANAPDAGWFRAADWDALAKLVDRVALARALVEAPHYHAYVRAVTVLLEEGDAPGLRRFLEVGSARPIDLRRQVAVRLALDAGDLTGLPILVEEILDTGMEGWLAKLPAGSGLLVATMVLDAALIGGHGACTEKRMWEVICKLADARLLDRAARASLSRRMLEEASTAPVRQAAAQYALDEVGAHERMVAVAEVFAWGVRRGVELAGRMFRFHLTSKERDLGHTFLDSNRVFVSALPMLRDEPHGKDIVEGLVLHELGHHVYHRSEAAQALWKQAHAEGLGHLLNLVADEHLERNLRALDASYGDRLKRLGAYGFQHAPQEIKLANLLASLRGAAASALIGTPLDVAFDEASVRLRRGAILAELEKQGHSLARFARALRMGLGNRHGDPRVGKALELCGRDLKKLDMAGLYALTKELAALFGGSIAVARVFGGPEGLEFGERDDDVFGAGLDDDILQREVERILDPKQNRSTRPAKSSGPSRLQINVAPDEDFDRITTVFRINGEPEVHRALASEVNRHALRLRQHLDELGLRWEPARARISGRALDRTRLQPLVTRSDPRILVARTPVRRTDLFLGTLIDCSGSMQAGRNIDRAKKFAILIAEAVRTLPGVEARFFGFTDSVIYDAGSADDCGVTGLHADGGNNDAAALFHAARIALSSRRRARVLVMISDGLPTECSVNALRGLVTTLTRRKGLVCAQVAVRKLEEQCFDHHVLLDDEDVGAAAAKFGRMIGDLARKALGSS